MNDRWREERIDEIVEMALAAPHDRRSEIISRECGGDEVMQAEVERIVAAHDAADGFLESPLVADDASDTGEHDPEELGRRFIGVSVGNYLIRGVVGIGGMGAVFEAEQQHPRRSVAVKLMRHGLVSRSAIKRFRYEAEILGSLNHPNIAHIHDAGMYDDGTGGVPFFAMELITGGSTIIDYARQRGVSNEDRVTLFIKVCHAVHYGHQKGVMHRDLKPGNILVNAEGEPKVIDFGVARSTGADLAVTTMPTDYGHLVGTAQYMSPEQLAGRSNDIDTRSDVYSLGVILHELLTGELPYAEPIETVFDATRIIPHGELRIAAQTTTINGQSEYGRRRGLSRDLAIIILKTLAKRPDDRYPSASALATELQRFLNGEPISARPPSRWQKVCRWITRHPFMATTAACVAMAATVLLLTVASVWMIAVRPHDLQLSNDRREVRLVSVGGHTLRTWRTDVEFGISNALMVNVPDELGGGRLALIGYTSNKVNPWPSSVCAFRIGRRFRNDGPVWIGSLEDRDIPVRLKDRGDEFLPNAFGVAHLRSLEIFPDTSGPQIVAVYSHNMRSQDAVRIYDAAGNVLYQAWHDGNIRDMHWMNEAGLLVLTGVNGLVYVEQREHGLDEETARTIRSPHPCVIFAIRPQRGEVTNAWICPDRHHEYHLEPVWYRCLLPEYASNYLPFAALRPPRGRYSPGTHVTFHAMRRDFPTASISFLIDEHGNEVSEARIVGDDYLRSLADGNLPDHNVFHFGDLPPLRPDATWPGSEHERMAEYNQE